MARAWSPAPSPLAPGLVERQAAEDEQIVLERCQRLEDRPAARSGALPCGVQSAMLTPLGT